MNPEQLPESVRNGTDLMSTFLTISPFVGLLGILAEDLRDNGAVLRLPWRDDLATTGSMLHGGAIAALADVTAMTAAWCGAPLPTSLRGVTTSLAMEFVQPANAQDVLGHGRVLRRGRTLSACEIDITTEAGELVAKAIASYKVG